MSDHHASEQLGFAVIAQDKKQRTCIWLLGADVHGTSHRTNSVCIAVDDPDATVKIESLLAQRIVVAADPVENLDRPVDFEVAALRSALISAGSELLTRLNDDIKRDETFRNSRPLPEDDAAEGVKRSQSRLTRRTITPPTGTEERSEGDAVARCLSAATAVGQAWEYWLQVDGARLQWVRGDLPKEDADYRPGRQSAPTPDAESGLTEPGDDVKVLRAIPPVLDGREVWLQT